MSLRHMYDAAYPIHPVLGCTVTAGYIGSPGATPHVWSKPEWQANSYTLRLPIYVPSWFRTRMWNASGDATECVNALSALGVPKGSAVALDFETEVNSVYVSEINANVLESGWRMLLYGSKDYVFQNPRTAAGYWAADWERTVEQGLIPGSVATQYRNLADWDLSVIDPSVQLWGDPIDSTSWTETLLNDLPTVQSGASGQFVRNVQGLLNAHGAHLSIDGVFGPLTKSEVEHVQSTYGIQIDGIVGRHTWATILTNSAQ